MSDDHPGPDDGEDTTEADPPPEASGPRGGATAFSNRPDPGKGQPEVDSPAQDERGRREPDWWRRKKTLIPAGILAILFLASLALFWPASSTSFEADPVATEIAADLAADGIEDAVVDVTDERALVRYSLPADMSAEESWLAVFDSLLEHAPDADLAVLQVYEGGPLEEVEADPDDVEAYFSGRIDYEEFRERIFVRPVA